tara:strand:- start:169 stop:1029 length:861 start_codon:yes stop_codon:yes gene_type:complete
MPELPEVETVRRGIEPIMTGSEITEVKQFRADLRWPLPLNMPKRLIGAKVTAVGRRSKYILIHLNIEETLIIHLGMTGRILISELPSNKNRVFPNTNDIFGPHDHVIIEFNHKTRVIYNDVRRFGAMDLIKKSLLYEHPWLAKLGPEPLSNDFSTRGLKDQLDRKKTSIKSVLMNQSVVAGLGNIYVSEVLWYSGISPIITASDLKFERIEGLKNSITSVLLDAIDKGGSSLKDYRKASGELGYFQNYFKTYNREGLECLSDECSGRIKKIIQSGRSSYYCPFCQT